MDNQNNSINTLDNYINSNERLKSNAPALQKINSLSFEKLINAAKGVREINYIQYGDTQIPFRLLSLKEERLLKHETHLTFKQLPEFIGGENHPEFYKLLMVKMLSKATTPAPEVDKPYFTEDDMEQMPAVAFWYLKDQYQKLNDEYNLAFNPEMETDIENILLAIFDGVPLNEKKLALLSGLSFSVLLQITIRLCNATIKLADNAQFITLFDDSNNTKVTENNE